MEKLAKSITIVTGGTSEETLLDKVKLLSDAIVELKKTVSDLRSSLDAEKDELNQLLDRLEMSKLDYETFRHTGKLPAHLQARRQECCSNDPESKMDADVLLESVGLSRGQYELFKQDGEIDWDLSDLGNALNKLIAEVEEENTSLGDLLEQL